MSALSSRQKDGMQGSLKDQCSFLNSRCCNRSVVRLEINQELGGLSERLHIRFYMIRSANPITQKEINHVHK